MVLAIRKSSSMTRIMLPASADLSSVTYAGEMRESDANSVRRGSTVCGVMPTDHNALSNLTATELSQCRRVRVHVADCAYSSQGMSGVSMPTGTGSSSPATILVVEDEIVIGLALTDFLRSCGYAAVLVASAEAAQRLLSTIAIDVVISDVNLGKGISGFGLAKWLREHHPDIRVILASGVWALAQEAAGLCDSPLVQKPYLYSDLSDSLRRLLASRPPPTLLVSRTHANPVQMPQARVTPADDEPGSGGPVIQ